MAKYMDFHNDLKLPNDALLQITQDTKDARKTSSASVSSSCSTIPKERCTACSRHLMLMQFGITTQL